ncbi:MAG: hypothetical protein M1838_002886 [Thelocarpon superellum]|nr:MAG: hypothetical protein M1838_002886 [Thelocarpon superellum]
MPTGQPRRFVVLLGAVAVFLALTLLYHARKHAAQGSSYLNVPVHQVDVSSDTLHGDVVATKLGNETLKAELGRAAWKVLHTTMARFPDKPTEDQSTALRSYLHLFARLYPCGECAGHFRQILSKFPPQVTSRSTAAAWACHVHNEVNKSLKKTLFDCSKIGDFYDCGCADDEEGGAASTVHRATSHEATTKLELKKEGKGDVAARRATGTSTGGFWQEQSPVAAVGDWSLALQGQALDEPASQSCVTEAQKYQGPAYRADAEKKGKSRSSKHDGPDPVVPKKAYVEDAPDPEANGFGVADAPPRAPSPPPAAEVNVFDFLVSEDTPNASVAALPPPEPMKMVQDAPAVFEASRSLHDMATLNASKETFGESRYGENGFHYGEGPVPTMIEDDIAYTTPAPYRERDRERDRERRRRQEDDRRRDHKKDNKRKRVHIDDLDLTNARPRGLERDEVMTDAPPELHSGLTGGLTRLLSSRPSDYPPSPDYSGGDGNQPSPNSPIKRSKHSRAEKERVANPIMALVSTRKTSSNSEEAARPRKHRRKHRHRHSDPERPSQKVKAIEYRPEDGAAAPPNQLVLYQTRAELFMSFINKGPESSKGCSLNKVMKRYHRERSDIGLGLGKGEEEKELWKTLRLRKNDRGEIVLFF